MQNIAPSRIISRRANQLLSLAFLLGAIGVFILAIGIVMFIVNFVNENSPSFGLFVGARTVIMFAAIVLILIALILALRAATYRKDNDLALGTGRYLEQYFDQSYTFIRNVSKREIGYVDAALIGPPGVMVFRIVNNTGVFMNEGANWLKRDKNGEWVTGGINPTLEDLADVRKVRDFLVKRGFQDAPVYGMVVFTQDPQRVALQWKDPQLPVTHLVNLYASLQAGYLTSQPLDVNRAAEVARALYA